MDRFVGALHLLQVRSTHMIFIFILGILCVFRFVFILASVIVFHLISCVSKEEEEKNKLKLFHFEDDIWSFDGVFLLLRTHIFLIILIFFSSSTSSRYYKNFCGVSETQIVFGWFVFVEPRCFVDWQLHRVYKYACYKFIAQKFRILYSYVPARIFNILLIFPSFQ